MKILATGLPLLVLTLVLQGAWGEQGAAGSTRGRPKSPKTVRIACKVVNVTANPQTTLCTEACPEKAKCVPAEGAPFGEGLQVHHCVPKVCTAEQCHEVRIPLEKMDGHPQLGPCRQLHRELKKAARLEKKKEKRKAARRAGRAAKRAQKAKEDKAEK